MINNPFEKAGDLPPPTSFFAEKNKPQPEIPQASAEMMVDLEGRFKDPFS